MSSFQFHIVLNDSDQQISAYGNIDLDPHCVLRSTPKLFNLEMLLEAFEKQFYLPAILVEFGNQ